MVFLKLKFHKIILDSELRVKIVYMPVKESFVNHKWLKYFCEKIIILTAEHVI